MSANIQGDLEACSTGVPDQSSGSERGRGDSPTPPDEHGNAPVEIPYDDTATERGRRYLLDLCYNDRWDKVEEFLTDTSISDDEKIDAVTYQADGSLWTPLHWACYWNAPPEVIRTLLDAPRGEEALLMKTGNGKTPLHAACCGRSNAAVIRILLDAMGEEALLMKDKYDQTPLHDACRCGDSNDPRCSQGGGGAPLKRY